MLFKRDPNITDRNEKALKVPCSYCGAKVGEMCWTLKDHDGKPHQVTTYQPHRHRIKAAWQKQYGERKKG